ncbi:TPA: hypothetical protein ACH3X3_014140 [Trebouxia sp. C0006]
MGDGNAPSATDAGASHIFRKTVDTKGTKADVGDERLPEQQSSPRAEEKHLGHADSEGSDDMHWAPADCEDTNSGTD